LATGFFIESMTVTRPRVLKASLTRSAVENRRTQKNEITIKNFAETMTDLARFRIVCNFLADMEKISQALRKSEELNEHFTFDVKDTTKVRPKG